MGPLDPTMIIDNSGVWRATRTAEGIATIHFAMTSGGVAVRAPRYNPLSIARL